MAAGGGAPTWSQLVAARDPDVPAVVTSEGSLTGTDLLAHAAGAADWLDSAGVPTGAPVPGLLVTSLTATALLVGGAGSGRPLAPLGPRLTARELAACLAQHDCPVVVADPEYADAARAATAGTGKRVEELPGLAPSRRPLDLDPAPGELVLIMHTSGTSGVPKKVPVRQDRLVARVRNSVPLTGVGPGAVYATMAPFEHIAGVGNVLITLATGATLAGAPRFSPEAWAGLSAFGVSHALLVPSMIETLLERDLLELPTLEMLQYGGSPIHPETLATLFERLPGVRLVQVYGTTEGSPITCLRPEDHAAAAAGARHLLLSNGTAAPETRIRVDRPDHESVGEICAQAPHVHRTDEDGWLHTGDLGRIDGAGYLYLVGRKGDRIVRGGENVDPLEVEQVLVRAPQVREVAVVGVPDRRLGECVVAYVVAEDDGPPPDLESLRRFARRDLAGFKVPERIVVVEELPKTASGKVLRRMLRSASD